MLTGVTTRVKIGPSGSTIEGQYKHSTPVIPTFNPRIVKSVHRSIDQQRLKGTFKQEFTKAASVLPPFVTHHQKHKSDITSSSLENFGGKQLLNVQIQNKEDINQQWLPQQDSVSSDPSSISVQNIFITPQKKVKKKAESSDFVSFDNSLPSIHRSKANLNGNSNLADSGLPGQQVTQPKRQRAFSVKQKKMDEMATPLIYQELKGKMVFDQKNPNEALSNGIRYSSPFQTTVKKQIQRTNLAQHNQNNLELETKINPGSFNTLNVNNDFQGTQTNVKGEEAKKGGVPASMQAPTIRVRTISKSGDLFSDQLIGMNTAQVSSFTDSETNDQSSQYSSSPKKNQQQAWRTKRIYNHYETEKPKIKTEEELNLSSFEVQLAGTFRRQGAQKNPQTSTSDKGGKSSQSNENQSLTSNDGKKFNSIQQKIFSEEFDINDSNSAPNSMTSKLNKQFGLQAESGQRDQASTSKLSSKQQMIMSDHTNGRKTNHSFSQDAHSSLENQKLKQIRIKDIITNTGIINNYAENQIQQNNNLTTPQSKKNSEFEKRFTFANQSEEGHGMNPGHSLTKSDSAASKNSTSSNKNNIRYSKESKVASDDHHQNDAESNQRDNQSTSSKNSEVKYIPSFNVSSSQNSEEINVSSIYGEGSFKEQGNKGEAKPPIQSRSKKSFSSYVSSTSTSGHKQESGTPGSMPRNTNLSVNRFLESNGTAAAQPVKKDPIENKVKLAKACIRFTVLGGGETIEAEDFSLPQNTTQIHNNPYDDHNSNKIRVNIKNVLEVESLMDQISSHLSNQSMDFINSAQNFINLINEDQQYHINSVFRFFSDDKLSKIGKVLTVLELVSVYLIQKIGKTKKSSLKQLFPQMKNLFSYVHQSFLMFWDQVYMLFTQNIPDKVSIGITVWSLVENYPKFVQDCLDRLRERIEDRRQVKLGNKKTTYLYLKQNYDIICNIIKPLIKGMKEESVELRKLFKICEDATIIETFNSIRVIFQGNLQTEEDINHPKPEIEQDKQGSVATAIPNQPMAYTEQRLVRTVKPYLPAQDPDRITLVLDLDETLIHFYETRSGGSYFTRPFCEKFLREMSKIFELVIFTAGTEDYANWVLNTLDKNRFISYRLFRQHTNFTYGVYVKDLSKIGRDMSKMLIIDNVPENFRLQKDNGIGIKSWYNDKSDTALRDLIPMLTELAQSNPEDIRPVLKKLRQKYPPNKVRGNFDLPI